MGTSLSSAMVVANQNATIAASQALKHFAIRRMMLVHPVRMLAATDAARVNERASLGLVPLRMPLADLETVSSLD